MRLNVQSDYALRLLMYLAVNRDRLCTISEIAAHYEISRNHMMKVAQQLGRSGFVDTVKGRSGGLRLAQEPDQIQIGSVVRRMEGDFAIVECFTGRTNKCLITPACRLTGILSDAVSAFLMVLDQSSIADLTSGNTRLHDLLRSNVA